MLAAATRLAADERAARCESVTVRAALRWPDHP
jgi:hypothetical protein